MASADESVHSRFETHQDRLIAAEVVIAQKLESVTVDLAAPLALAGNGVVLGERYHHYAYSA